VIIWLEDREGTIMMHRALLDQLGLEYALWATPATFVSYLGSECEILLAMRPPPIFIIDIMLYGIKDLSIIKITDAPTLKGNHAGYVFADRYLRSNESKWAKFPLCFLTERDIDGDLAGDIDLLRKRNQGPIKILRKYSQEDLETFSRAINGWMSNGKIE